MFTDLNRLCHGGQHNVGQRHHVMLSGSTLNDNDEFVAAHSRHQLSCATAARQPSRNSFQQLIADVVAQTVIDHFESVKVQKTQPDPALTGRPSEYLG
jgi:hypothetical protein